MGSKEYRAIPYGQFVVGGYELTLLTPWLCQYEAVLHQGTLGFEAQCSGELLRDTSPRARVITTAIGLGMATRQFVICNWTDKLSLL